MGEGGAAGTLRRPLGHVAPHDTSVKKKISTNVHSYLSSTEHVVLKPWTLSHQPLQEETRKKEAIRINLSLCFNLSACRKGRISNAYFSLPIKKLSRANQKEKKIIKSLERAQAPAVAMQLLAD